MNESVKEISNFSFHFSHLISGRGVQLQTIIEKDKRKPSPSQL
jgi:phosphoribosyl-ATP pyrophosphohydrolase